MQTYLESQQELSVLLETAQRDGVVRIQRRDGNIFLLRPETNAASPLDVAGVDLYVTTEEIVAFVREGRDRAGN